MTDPIADYLTRIRNALLAKHASVDIPFSALKVEVTKILEKEGYIEGYRVVEGSPRGSIKIALRYGRDGDRVINGLTRISRPGRRVYCSKGDIPKVLGGLGISILSTSKGVMSGQEGRRQGIGGEVLCTVW
jgi:small subunit ribosomal protein S8